ncbi:NADP-dependent oxidoreductase [uncultured Methylovirgula sp.]|uniref:NADP-dependent oxidoreductase n=1 Tax=uncultured Methylovirgula sp. TaxID=1285960 RepID=UPI00261C10CE|nr:NADP-dependent oxidoreductase [uncultured Methylovirgula sp.]
MKAVAIREFGGPDVLTYADVPVRSPGPGEVLVRVRASGVGPWDAWIREGRSALPQPLPLILGSDISGLVEATGLEVSGFVPGQSVFGVTNPRFTGGYAEFATVEARMIAPKPARLTDAEAASVPVIATTAWQMLFDHAGLQPNQRVLVLGGGGNVGAYAVRLAAWAGADVVATGSAAAETFVRSLGARAVIDGRNGGLSGLSGPFDVIIDTVGEPLLGQSFQLLRPGGFIISAVAMPDQSLAARHHARAEFILVDVGTSALTRLAALFDDGTLQARVGEILPLSAARTGHEMLAGRLHKPGKIVLLPGTS